MIHIPVLRWGEPYKSLDVDKVAHFATGEPLAEVSRANGGLIERDMRKAPRAREALREVPIRELLQKVTVESSVPSNALQPVRKIDPCDLWQNHCVGRFYIGGSYSGLDCLLWPGLRPSQQSRKQVIGVNRF